LRGNVSREEWNSFIVWIGTESSAWIRLEFCVAVCFFNYGNGYLYPERVEKYKIW
jgi:hypothetical protein